MNTRNHRDACKVWSPPGNVKQAGRADIQVPASVVFPRNAWQLEVPVLSQPDITVPSLEMPKPPL